MKTAIQIYSIGAEGKIREKKSFQRAFSGIKMMNLQVDKIYSLIYKSDNGKFRMTLIGQLVSRERH